MKHLSFAAMMNTKLAEAKVSVEALTIEQRRELYARWIACFGYEELLGEDVPAFDPEWSATFLTNNLFNCDPIEQLLQFLIDEKLVNQPA